MRIMTANMSRERGHLMQCPNCAHAPSRIDSLSWCPRCGTYFTNVRAFTPKLVGRLLEFCATLDETLEADRDIIESFELFGIRESITLPGQQ